MLNRSASLAMSTSVLKALPGKLDIKKHSPSILYIPLCFVRLRSYQSLSSRAYVVATPIALASGAKWKVKVNGQLTYTILSSKFSLL